MKLLGSKKETSSSVPLLETKAENSSSGGFKLKSLKTIAILLVAAVVIVFAIILIIRLTTEEGKKKAEKLSEYLGTNVGSAEDKLNMHLKDNSAYAILNKSDAFDYIYESEDSVNISDIKFPEWTVTVIKTSSEKIDSVIYTDYNLLKSDSRGEKLAKRPDLDSFGRSTKMKTVLDAIDTSPFRIIYSLDSTKYEFRYCYELDNGDIQSVALIVCADLEGKYIYSSSEDLDPFFITSKVPSSRTNE